MHKNVDFRKIAQWIVGVPTIILFALIALCFGLLIWMWIIPMPGAMGMVGAVGLIVIARRLAFLIPLFLASFIVWVLLTRFKVRKKLLSLALALAPVAWAYFPWGGEARCLENECFVCADVHPVSSEIYFITQHDVLINDNPPFNPNPMKCDLVLERMKADGSGRTEIMHLLPDRIWGVDVKFEGDKPRFVESAPIRFRLSPDGMKAVLDVREEQIYVLDLNRREALQIRSKQGLPSPPGDGAKYEYSYIFVSWLTDDRLLLMRQERKWEYGGGSPIESALVLCDADGSDEKVVAILPKTAFWLALADDRLVIDRGISAQLDLTNSQLSDWRRTQSDLCCGELLRIPATNSWLSSNGLMINGNLEVVRSLPQAPGGIQAWSKDGVVVTDWLKGLMIVNPDTGEYRTLLTGFINRRSPIRDKETYRKYQERVLERQKAIQAMQEKAFEQGSPNKRLGVGEGSGTGGDEAPLLEGLGRHDTNTLSTARSLLWEGGNAFDAAASALLEAHWDEADNAVGEFLVSGTNTNRKCQLLGRLCNCCPVRFEQTIIQLASDCSQSNALVAAAALPCLKRLGGAEVGPPLATLATMHPELDVRDEALTLLQHWNKALYKKTLLALTNDDEFLVYYPKWEVAMAAAQRPPPPPHRAARSDSN